jgi:solute carrier family 25 thiamine pyrophosphate transporter 19
MYILLTYGSLFKAAPASAVTMWTYERVLHNLLDMEATAKAAEGG